MSLPIDEIGKKLKNSVCLGIGGLGSVGNSIVRDLLKFDVSKLIFFEIKSTKLNPLELNKKKIEFSPCDIRDEIFFSECIKKFNLKLSSILRQ